MSFVEVFDDCLRGIDGDHELTGIDSKLIRYKLDPQDAATNTGLKIQGLTEEDIEARVDAIYTAANAGDKHARYVIHAAAYLQSEYELHSIRVQEEPLTVEEIDESLAMVGEAVSAHRNGNGHIPVEPQ